MRGARPLDDAELEQVLDAFRGKFAVRNRAMFYLGIKTGFRVSEILRVRVGDLVHKGGMAASLTVMKTKRTGSKHTAKSRTVPLHPGLESYIIAQVEALREAGHMRRDCYFFQSRAAGNRAISRVQAWRVIQQVCKDILDLEGRLGTHVMRKTFARIKLEWLKDEWQPGKEIPIQGLRDLLGQDDIRSTQNYVTFDDADRVAAFTES